MKYGITSRIVTAGFMICHMMNVRAKQKKQANRCLLSGLFVEGGCLLMMLQAEDLIRRRDAIAVIYDEMKKTYTPARKGGMKRDIELLKKLPSVETDTAKHSFWFVNAGWWFCDNCGGRGSFSKTTAFCPHCGAKMDEMQEIE